MSHNAADLMRSQRNLCIPGLKLFGTQRVCDVFKRVAQTVGIVIGWVDTPEERGRVKQE